MDTTIDRLPRYLRLALALALFLALMFLAGAAIPYACHVHNLDAERLDELEAALRKNAEDLGRQEANIQAAIDELRRHYGRR